MPHACACAEELTATGKEALVTGKSTDAQITALVVQVKRLADAAEAEKKNAGGGTPTKAAGAAFNPFTASVGALGGDEIRVTFPKGMHMARAVKHRPARSLGNVLGRVGFTTHVPCLCGTSAVEPSKSVWPPVT